MNTLALTLALFLSLPLPSVPCRDTLPWAAPLPGVRTPCSTPVLCKALLWAAAAPPRPLPVPALPEATDQLLRRAPRNLLTRPNGLSQLS